MWWAMLLPAKLPTDVVRRRVKASGTFTRPRRTFIRVAVDELVTTATRLAATAVRGSTPKPRARRGTRNTPPPRPSRAPRVPVRAPARPKARRSTRGIRKLHVPQRLRGPLPRRRERRKERGEHADREHDGGRGQDVPPLENGKESIAAIAVSLRFAERGNPMPGEVQNGQSSEEGAQGGAQESEKKTFGQEDGEDVP